MPFGGESFPDAMGAALIAASYGLVTNAFRRGVLSGPEEQTPSPLLGKLWSPMPFGGESFPDQKL